MWHHVSEGKRDTAIANVVFEKKSEVLELYDLFSHFSLSHGGILNTYKDEFSYMSYIHELKYSYIYYKAGIPRLSEMSLDSVVRLTNNQTYPWETKPRVTIYVLTLGSNLNQINKLVYGIDSTHNFLQEKEEIIPLKGSEIKTLNKIFKACLEEEIKYSTKTKLGNPFLIELKMGNSYEIIERNEGIDDDVVIYYSKFQGFIQFVNRIGQLPPAKIQKRKERLK